MVSYSAKRCRNRDDERGVPWLKNWFVNVSTRRPRALWRILIGYVSMMVIIGVLAAIVDAIEVPWIESFAWQLVSAPLLITLARLLARSTDRREYGEYGLGARDQQAKHLMVGILAGATLTTAIFLSGYAVGAIKVTGFAQTTYSVPWILTFLGFMFRYASVGVFEELFHRGFLITNLSEGFRSAFGRQARMIALVASSLIFGLLHFGNDHATGLAALNIFLLGVLLGLPYVRTGSLYASVGLHFAWNFFLGNIYGLPVSGYESRTALIRTESTDSMLWTGGSFGPEGSIIATGLVIVAILVTFRLTASRAGKIET